jgi:ABC-type transporter Mla MlaB component
VGALVARRTVVLTYQVLDAHDSQVQVALSGSLADQDWTRELQRFLEPHYIDDDVRFIELDLRGVDRIDLEGVATLLRLSADAIAVGKSFGVTGAKGRVWSKLQETSALSHLDKGKRS